MLSTAEKGSCWELGIGLIEKSKTSGMRLDLISYTAIVTAFENAERWTCALHALGSMPSQSCLPHNVVFTSGLLACSAGQAWEHVFVLFQALRSQDVTPETSALMVALMESEQRGLQGYHALLSQAMGVERTR